MTDTLFTGLLSIGPCLARGALTLPAVSCKAAAGLLSSLIGVACTGERQEQNWRCFWRIMSGSHIS